MRNKLFPILLQYWAVQYAHPQTIDQIILAAQEPSENDRKYHIHTDFLCDKTLE